MLYGTCGIIGIHVSLILTLYLLGTGITYMTSIIALENTMTWSTLVEGDEQLDRLRGKSTYELMHSQLKQKTITYCVAYWEGPYSCSSPSTKVLHDYGSVTILGDFLTFLVANFLSQIFDDLLGYFKNIILKVKMDVATFLATFGQILSTFLCNIRSHWTMVRFRYTTQGT